jgi:hypothetical protein
MAEAIPKFVSIAQELSNGIYNSLPSTSLLQVATTCAQLHGEALVAFYFRYTLAIGDHSADDKTKEG